MLATVLVDVECPDLCHGMVNQRSVAKGLNRLAVGRAFFDLLTLMEVRGDRERV